MALLDCLRGTGQEVFLVETDRFASVGLDAGTFDRGRAEPDRVLRGFRRAFAGRGPPNP